MLATIAIVFAVGPGQPYAALRDVPFESLAAGDVVLVYWRDTPYKEKLVVGGDDVTIRGVVGPNGERPIIDGAGATTRAQLNFWSQTRSVIKIGGSSAPADQPSHVVIENLDIRGGHPNNTFRDSHGAQQAYADNAAAIMIENGNHITIRNCILRDSANGLFAASGSADVLVERNHIYGNGVTNDIYVHNNYTEANGITFQFNEFGPLAPGAGGNNLKDRSAGTVIRYNWIEGGNRQLDLVDSEHFATLAAFHTTYVYGNVLLEHAGSDNRQMVHYGGDSGTLGDYRKGTLYFYANTVVSERTDRTTVFRLSSSGESVDARNNIFYAANGIDLLDHDGNVKWGWNWSQPSLVASGAITDLGGRVTGSDPGFASRYHLAENSPARDRGGPLASGAPAVTEQYDGARAVDRALDIGAFEYSTMQPGVDAGVTDDARVDEEEPPHHGGCSTSSPSLWLFLLYAGRRRTSSHRAAPSP